MNGKDLYVYADFTQSAVQQMIQDLKSQEYKVFEVKDDDEAFRISANERSHLLIALNSSMNVRLLGLISEQARNAKSYLYFIGNPQEIFPDKSAFLEKVPGVHFSGFPIDYQTLSDAVEYNEREKKRVLIVDDEPIMLRSVKMWLGEDFEVSLVNSGETALDFLTTHPVDLVLLDYRMPGMTGPDVLKALREDEQNKNLPIIFLTSKNDKESIVKVMSLKPDGYILKSKSPEEIKATVVNFVKTRVWSR